MDYDLVDFALTLPDKCKIHKRLVYSEMKRFHPFLARIPLYSSPVRYWRLMSAANIGLFMRIAAQQIPLLKKVAKIQPPTDGWADYLRDQRSYVEKVLFDERTLSRGFFNHAKIRVLLNEHMCLKGNHAHLICRLLSLELWFRWTEDTYGLEIFHVQSSNRELLRVVLEILDRGSTSAIAFREVVDEVSARAPRMALSYDWRANSRD
jgi:hypothetical protein